MCMIVDTNKLVRFLAVEDDGEGNPIRKWLGIESGKVEQRNKASGILVYSTGGQFANEIPYRARRRLEIWAGTGRARYVPREEVESVAESLEREGVCKSNDFHVLALAIVSGARGLYTSDKDLMSDFKNRAIMGDSEGKIYPIYRKLESEIGKVQERKLKRRRNQMLRTIVCRRE